MAEIKLSFIKSPCIGSMPCNTGGYIYPGRRITGRFKESILKNGLLEPLTVDENKRIINGINRLFALQSLGEQNIPIIRNCDDYSLKSTLLLSKLKAKQPDFFTQADILSELTEQHLISREYLAQHLNVSVSYISNKLRLADFDETCRKLIIENGLTERHARTVLRVSKECRNQVIEEILQKELTVRETEEYIDSICAHKQDSISNRFRNAIRLCNEISEKAKAFDYTADISDRETDYRITVYLRPNKSG